MLQSGKINVEAFRHPVEPASIINRVTPRREKSIRTAEMSSGTLTQGPYTKVGSLVERGNFTYL